MRFSVLDRLTDPALGRVQDLRESDRDIDQLKAFICRDLTALLNTRRAEHDFDASYEQAVNSLLTFGIVDFTSYNLNSVLDQEQARSSIERSIRQFESRLSQVYVALEPADGVIPILRFQIEAVLRLGEISEEVTFYAKLPRDSRHISVSGLRQ